jgi:hypothetical protein
MRYLLCILLGVAIGAIGALAVANTLQRRHAWPRAVMTMLGHDLRQLREGAKNGRCSDIGVPLARLRTTAADIGPAFLEPGTPDRVFSQYASDLAKALGAVADDADCARRAAAITAVGHACEACHRDYR